MVEQLIAALCAWLEKEAAAVAPRDDSCESIDSDSSSKAPPASFAVILQRFLDLIDYTVRQLQLVDQNAPEAILTDNQITVCCIAALAMPCR